MKGGKALRASVGAGLCAVGIGLVLAVPRDEKHTFRIAAGGCHLVTDIVEPAGGSAPTGYVLLLHGLAANKRVVSYWTQGFASQGLRVFVPDLPGHGRTEGPFSFDRADQCTENLLRELVGRGLLDPERTVLAGHSMGGAIALRVAARNAVAGVVAISPAPLRPIPALPREVMPFPDDFPKMPSHALVMFGGWEPGSIGKTAADLVPAANDSTDKYMQVPRASHVSILFDRQALENAQNWAASVLHFERRPILPSRGSLIGFLLGLVGILTMTGPFLRELLESKKGAELQVGSAANLPKSRILLEFGLLALGAVGILRFWIPLRPLRLFEGDYFASLLLILGLAALGLNWRRVREMIDASAAASNARLGFLPNLMAAFGGVLLYILFSAWVDLGFMEAWPTAGRIARFFPLLLAVVFYHLAEELALGPIQAGRTLARLTTALLIRLLVWLTIVAGILFLHSGEIIPVVLAPSLALFSVGQRWGMDVVRNVTRSPSASALFGAILLAGFCLVVFPAT